MREARQGWLNSSNSWAEVDPRALSSPILEDHSFSIFPFLLYQPSKMASSSSSATTALRHLATLRSRIFNTAPPPPLSAPGGLRTGAKILKSRLVGPSMLGYYPPTTRLRDIGRQIWGMQGEKEEGLMLMSAKEAQRFEDVARKRRLGKGPPKKGEYRRANTGSLILKSQRMMIRGVILPHEY